MNINDLFANRYRLIKKLGSGGFSEVWQVADTEVDNTVEALKVYLPNRQFEVPMAVPSLLFHSLFKRLRLKRVKTQSFYC